MGIVLTLTPRQVRNSCSQAGLLIFLTFGHEDQHLTYSSQLIIKMRRRWHIVTTILNPGPVLRDGNHPHLKGDIMRSERWFSKPLLALLLLANAVAIAADSCPEENVPKPGWKEYKLYSFTEGEKRTFLALEKKDEAYRAFTGQNHKDLRPRSIRVCRQGEISYFYIKGFGTLIEEKEKARLQIRCESHSLSEVEAEKWAVFPVPDNKHWLMVIKPMVTKADLEALDKRFERIRKEKEAQEEADKAALAKQLEQIDRRLERLRSKNKE